MHDLADLTLLPYGSRLRCAPRWLLPIAAPPPPVATRESGRRIFDFVVSQPRFFKRMHRYPLLYRAVFASVRSQFDGQFDVLGISLALKFVIYTYVCILPGRCLLTYCFSTTAVSIVYEKLTNYSRVGRSTRG